MSVKRFSMGEAVNFGWDTMKKNIGFFIGILLTSWIACGVPQFIGGLFQESVPALSIVFQLVSTVIQILVTIGLTKICIQFCDGKVPKFSELFSNMHLFLKVFAASILQALIVLGGLILLIIPGIIFSIKLQFVTYLVVDKGMGPVEAVKRSWLITKGIKWQLFLFGLLLGVINILGMLVLFVGLFVTVPVTMIAYTYVYRKLEGNDALVQMPAQIGEYPV